MIRRMFVGVAFVIGACATAAAVPTTQTPQPASAPERPGDPTATPRVVILVRHAEKTDDAADALLSDIGHARARCLAHTTEHATITHVLATEVQRTRDTVAPIAARLGREIEVIRAADRDRWVQRLRELPAGAIAIAAGHSNTIPELVAALTGAQVSVGHDTYDAMFVVTLDEHDRGSVLSLRYCPST